MYIYNITFNIDRDIKEEWFKYIKEKFIPEMLKKGSIDNALISEIVNNDPGKTYSILFFANDKENFKEFLKHDVIMPLHRISLKFEPKMVYFGTQLDVIDKVENNKE